MVKLAESKTSKNKARNFNNAVTKRGFALRVPVSYIKVLAPDAAGTVKHPILRIEDMAKEIFRSYEDKLFAGRSVESAKGLFLRFWRTFRQVQPESKVFQIHSQDELQFCIPCKLHIDEGTGVRKSAVLRARGDPSSHLVLLVGTDIFFGLLWVTKLTGSTIRVGNGAKKYWAH